LKKLLMLGMVIIVVAVGISALTSQKTATKDKLTVQAIDNKGVFVGDQKLAPMPLRNSEVSPEIWQEQEGHEANLRAIDEAAEYIRIGDRNSKAGNLQEAAAAYKTAYSIGGGSKAVSGLLLAEVYEQLGRYDEGIALLDEMMAKPYLSENGIQNADEIRTRLLAAKNVADLQSDI